MLILPSINEFFSPAKDQHGFRPRHSTTSSLLQLTTYIETVFSQRKPPHRTLCVYLRDVGIYLKENSLLICAPKSTVTLFTQDNTSFRRIPILLSKTQLPLERNPKILRVIIDPSLSTHKHCTYVSDRIDKRNNMLKALGGSSWGHEKETTADLQRIEEIYRNICSTSLGHQRK